MTNRVSQSSTLHTLYSRDVTSKIGWQTAKRVTQDTTFVGNEEIRKYEESRRRPHNWADFICDHREISPPFLMCHKFKMADEEIKSFTCRVTV